MRLKLPAKSTHTSHNTFFCAKTNNWLFAFCFFGFIQEKKGYRYPFVLVCLVGFNRQSTAPNWTNLKMQHDEPSDRAVVDPSNQPIVRLKHRSVVLPDRRRVVINLKLNATDPNYAIALQLTDLPLRPNDSDLILMTKNYYLIENRWKFDNELVDYRVIQFFDTGERFDVNFQSLKRIKIYGLRNELSSRAQIDLLMILCSCTQVEHLEMDTLDVVEDSDTDLSFNSLRLFSIDSIQIVDKNGREVAEKRATIRLKAPQLEKVYSGRSSVSSLSFSVLQQYYCYCSINS